MPKDKLFLNDIQKQFEFDEKVASVFDDMLNRSVPFYKEVQDLISSLISKEAKENDRVLDIGSSTASFLLNLYIKRDDLELIGIDNSKAMVERARNKALAFGAKIELILEDIFNYDIKDFNFIVANYTLQFIRPIDRIELIKKIYNGLKKGGVFYFSEKIIFNDKKLDKEIIDIYYEYKKKQGYSQYEIAKKREALENVLIPFTIKENIKLCEQSGFKRVDTLFQWANFATFRAIK
ncbi:MAG: carboxy-S-adenosyl-L-methionine synthase CmoA [Epsilonproteobacteria bacterium]|nr:carboxy-S-adenosyl-L-methionine synthase CmoA [Campylobacterota bacterium]